MTRSQNYLSTYLLLCNVTVFYLCECAMKGRSKKDERIATEVVFRVYSLSISVGVARVCFPGVNQLMPGRVPVHSIVITSFTLYSYNMLWIGAVLRCGRGFFLALL